MTSGFDAFLELEYGKLCFLDLHGKTLEEAKAELVYTLSTVDSGYNGVVVIHGYHKGVVLKNYVRNTFTHKLLKKKINLDASRTLLIVNPYKTITEEKWLWKL